MDVKINGNDLKSIDLMSIQKLDAPERNVFRIFEIKRLGMQYIIVRFFILSFLLLMPMINKAQVKIYLLPGQGSDYRLYENFKFPSHYQVHHIKFPIPEKEDNMQSYALKIAKEIDTSGYTILVGTSLGGMLTVELNKELPIDKTIIISSAKCRDELPFRYTFQKYIPIYKIVPKKIIKRGALILQPLVEPDRKKNKETFVSMLKSKDPLYLKRTIQLMVQWENKDYNEEIIHIHGKKDHTLPYRNIHYDYLIEKGSHMMTLTRGEELYDLIIQIIEANLLSLKGMKATTLHP